MYEEKASNSVLKEKSLSLGEQIYHLLYDYGPNEQRDALNEARERINNDYSYQLESLKEKARAIESRHKEFNS